MGKGKGGKEKVREGPWEREQRGGGRGELEKRGKEGNRKDKTKDQVYDKTRVLIFSFPFLRIKICSIIT